jgi:hypothetical protein
MARRDGRVAEGARLESVYTFTGIGGSNPSLSAILSSVPRLYQFRDEDHISCAVLHYSFPADLRRTRDVAGSMALLARNLIPNSFRFEFDCADHPSNPASGGRSRPARGRGIPGQLGAYARVSLSRLQVATAKNAAHGDGIDQVCVGRTLAVQADFVGHFRTAPGPSPAN